MMMSIIISLYEFFYRYIYQCVVFVYFDGFYLDCVLCTECHIDLNLIMYY